MNKFKRVIKAITERNISTEEQSIKLYEKKLKLLSLKYTFDLKAIAEELKLVSDKEGLSNVLIALHEEAKVEIEDAKLKLHENEEELMQVSLETNKSIDDLANNFDRAKREAEKKKTELLNHYNLDLNVPEIKINGEERKRHREMHKQALILKRFLNKYSIIFWSEIIEELRTLTLNEAVKSIENIEDPTVCRRKISAIEIPDKSIKYISNVVKTMTDPIHFLIKRQDLSINMLKEISEKNPILFTKVKKGSKVITYNNFMLIASDNDKYTNLTEFDMAIYSQIINLFKEGNKIFSVNDIIRCWKKGVKTAYNKGIVQDIENTLDKLNALDIYLDYSEEHSVKDYDIKNTTIVVQKLLYTHKTWEIPERGKKEREYYTIIEEPPLSEYLDVNIQKLTLNREDYNIPLTLNKKNIVLHDIMLEQIAFTRNAKHKVRLKIQTIANRLDLSDDLKTLKRLTQDIEELGDFFAQRRLLAEDEPLTITGRGKRRLITFNKNPNSQLKVPN